VAVIRQNLIAEWRERDRERKRNEIEIGTKESLSSFFSLHIVYSKRSACPTVMCPMCFYVLLGLSLAHLGTRTPRPAKDNMRWTIAHSFQLYIALRDGIEEDVYLRFSNCAIFYKIIDYTK